MVNRKLAQNYASALFNNAIADSLEDKILGQIIVIDELINDNQQIKSIMSSPIIKNEEKLKIIQLIEKLLEVEIIVKRFLSILVKHSRMPIFSDIVSLYQQLLNESRNTKIVAVTSSKILQLAEREWIKKYLEDDLQQKVSINYNHNQSIIGGLIIQYDSIMRDYSIAGMLKKISKSLKNTKIDWDSTEFNL